MKTIIRQANLNDIADIQLVFEKAKQFMRNNGNYKQWVNGYPSVDIIKNDIYNKECYVVEYEQKIAATFVIQESIDENYLSIEGKWLNNEKYVAIHRIASNGIIHGVLKLAHQLALTKAKNIRCDTHEDNIPMQQALLKLEFKYCGIIYLKSDNTPRLAYQYKYD